MENNPLSQFKINKIIDVTSIFGYDINFTNSALYLALASLLSLIILIYGTAKASLVPNKIQAVVEMLYQAVCNTIVSNTGKEGLKHKAMIFTIFIFILTCNLVGMLPIPYAFTPTSHVSITFALALFIFLWCALLSLKNLGLRFFNIFLPKGTPWWLAPMMILVEVFAYFARPISLSVRLSANMIAGHTILKVIAGFVLSGKIIFAIFPLIFVTLLIVFEIFIAILQAYIFMMLTCVYLNDALNSH
ncbi:MAG: F0F1 ATP synthase subunit A [Rickettsiaceae bacterium H1]|nr:F0F1 ATP synthase subunit A [Rickettsiaceae bacterium H1]